MTTIMPQSKHRPGSGVGAPVETVHHSTLGHTAAPSQRVLTQCPHVCLPRPSCWQGACARQDSRWLLWSRRYGSRGVMPQTSGLICPFLQASADPLPYRGGRRDAQTCAWHAVQSARLSASVCGHFQAWASSTPCWTDRRRKVTPAPNSPSPFASATQSHVGSKRPARQLA